MSYTGAGAGIERRLRRMLFGAVPTILVQASLGMAVNLFVTVPIRHPGSKPSNYLAGSYHSVV